VPLALDAQGNPHVVYATGSGVRYARRSGGAWVIETASPDPIAFFSSMSIAIDGAGNPHYTYGTPDGDLLYASRTAGAWTFDVVLDTTNTVGGFSSLALDADDAPHIAFTDGTGSDLLYAHAPSLTSVRAGAVPGRLSIFPNPARGGAATIRWSGASPAPAANAAADAARRATVEALVFDVQGRLVRRLFSGADPAGGASIRWDGRSESGRVAAPGSYVVRMLSGGVPLASKRLIIVR
jgi:hypothetical protein